MKKCKLCKQLNVREFNGIAVSKYCVTCRKAKIQEKKEKHSRTKGAQEGLRKKLHKKAWRLFSEYIRRKGANEYGAQQCYTCTLIAQWKNLHAGHYFHGRLDFDERNVNPQCERCNYYRSGMGAVYGVRLAGKLGVEGIQQLELDANTKGNDYTISELETLIEVYKKKLEELDNQ